MLWRGLLEKYKEYLPVTEETPMLSLHEGNTPLLPMRHLSEKFGIEHYVKYDGANPTGSFKDRGMVMAVAKAKEAGSEAIMCASTGNTSAAAAAYAAQAKMRCLVVIPDGKIAMGKLAQAVVYGAEIVSIEGNFDNALQMVRNLEKQSPISLVNSVNPHRIEGQKTAAFEIVDALGTAPDVLTIPVGNAGNITAYWQGFKEYHDAKQSGLPQMRGFEAEGSAAIVKDKIIDAPETLATAIRIGNPASWDKAVSAARESGGAIDYVTDDQIIEAYKLLASEEGVFAEPASAASVAGLIKQLETGEIAKGSRVVSVLTGNGLKDPDTAINTATLKPVKLPNDEQVVFDHMLGRVKST
ncbi:threonine synthase [Alkalicoccus chagannorensis]|uniref:threonine synthase n=1 Tax=Alkalicoccus chagannorensis TaxID=427072 RepID=UPI00041AADE1|nr:threonine synthase [Alkalicoccus chagannorensis]